MKALGLYPPNERINAIRPVVVFECPQAIPCDSCLESCKIKAIKMDNINDIPIVDFAKCTGCGKCLMRCPGLAAFLVQVVGERGYVTMQYEFLPIPKKGEKVTSLDRSGNELGEAMVVRIIPSERNDGTAIVTVEIPREIVMEVRAIKPQR